MRSYNLSTQILVLNTMTGDHWFCQKISFEFDKEFGYAYAHFPKWFRLDPNRKKEEEKKPLLIWKCGLDNEDEFERYKKISKMDLTRSRFADANYQELKETQKEVMELISDSFYLIHKVYYPTSYEYTFYKDRVMKKTVQNLYLSPQKQDDIFSLYLATINDTIFKESQSPSSTKVILYSLCGSIKITPIESVIMLNNTPLKTSSFRYWKKKIWNVKGINPKFLSMEQNMQGLGISHNTRTRFTFSGDITLSFYTDDTRLRSTSTTNYPYIIISQSEDSEKKQDRIKIHNTTIGTIDEHKSCSSYTNK